MWDIKSASELFTLTGHTGYVHSVVKLPDGWLASGSSDRTIKVWYLEQKKEVRTLSGHTDSVVSLQETKKGNLVSYSCDDTVTVWNPYLAEGNLLVTISGHANWKSYTPVGILSNGFLVTCSTFNYKREENILRAWNPEDGKLVKSMPTELYAIWPLLVLSNDQIVLGTAYKGIIKILDLNNEKKSRTRASAHDLKVTSLLQLSNGNLVSAGVESHLAPFSSSFNSLKVWNVADLSLLQRIKTSHTDIIYSLSINEDETVFVSGSWDQTIELWPTSIKTPR